MHDTSNARPSRADLKVIRKQLNYHKVSSAIGSQRGRTAEIKAVRAFAPKWRNRKRYVQVIKQVRQATDFEDNVLKYDIVLETHIPSHPVLGVQIKTSFEDYLAFTDAYPDIPTVHLGVFDLDSSEIIRKKVWFSILHKHPGLADEMKKLGCEASPKMLAKIASIEPGSRIIMI